MSIPNILTVIRMTLIPILVLTYHSSLTHAYLLSAFVFFAASFTDWLDGYLARSLQQESTMGAFLDPVADKLLVVVALIMLVQSYNFSWMTLAAGILISRELIISALRELMAELGKRATVSVSNIGKIKTFMQMLAITILLSQDPSQLNKIIILGFACLYISVILALWSMGNYLAAAKNSILK